MNHNPVLLALLAGLFTWFVTALGAASSLFVKHTNKRISDAMLGFAGGVMFAASYWSLLAPAIEMSETSGQIAWLPPTVGFLLGAGFLYLLDKIVPHLHIGLPESEAEGIHTKLKGNVLLVLAVTLHNIPEGLAVGVAFGALGPSSTTAEIAAASALALGIGIQNFPEGFAVSMPLRGMGLSRFKSFWYGQLSGFVEPVFAVIGAFAVSLIHPLLPYALAFAAGAMIFVVVEEVIPESQQHKDTDMPTISFIIGFTVMMVLDVALG